MISPRYPRKRTIILTMALCLTLVVATGFTLRSMAAQEALGLSYISASQSTLAADETLTYSIHVINDSTTPATANVSDKIPVELAYKLNSASHGGLYDQSKSLLTWDGVQVPPQSELVITFAVTSAAVVETETEVINKVSIQVVAEDGLGQILTSGVSIKLLPGEPPPPTPLVNAFKLASQPTLAPGATLTYTIMITNSGVDPVNVSVTDTLPVELAIIEGSQSGDGLYDPVLHMISWRSVNVEAMSETALTFDVHTVQDSITNPANVTNTAKVIWGTEEIYPTVTITLVSAPLHYSNVLPVVNQLTIGTQDVISDPNVQLHIDASPDAAWMFIREYVVKSVNGYPTWAVDHSSGWIPFESDPNWVLGNTSGVHYVGVVVADVDRVYSVFTHQSFDFVSLNLPNTQTETATLLPYLVYYDAGVDVAIQLTPASGNADLYVWYPGNFWAPNQTSLQPGTAVDQVTFTTPSAGIYIILVHALEAVTYNMTIVPAGGPNAPVTGIPTQLIAQNAAAGQFVYEPIFTNPMGIGLDPLGSAEPIAYLNILLPMVQR